MSDACDQTPIASEQQYKAALLAVRERMTGMQLRMLQAHCGAPDHTITAAQLACDMCLGSFGTANLHYGKFAHWIADAINYSPELEPKSKFSWWRAMAYGRPGSEGAFDGDYKWVMRPELVAVLKSMKWA